MSRIYSTFQASNSSLFGRFVPLGNEGKDGLFTINLKSVNNLYKFYV